MHSSTVHLFIHFSGTQHNQGVRDSYQVVFECLPGGENEGKVNYAKAREEKGSKAGMRVGDGK